MNSPAENIASERRLPPVWLAALKPYDYAENWAEEAALKPLIEAAFDDLADFSSDEKTHRHQLLDKLRQALDKGNQRLQQRFLRDHDGALLVGAQAHLMDALIRRLAEHAMLLFPDMERDGLAVLATGGYGRGEMAPHSDIDLLFLTRTRPDSKAGGETMQPAILFMLYTLWDLGLTVGHASRSLNQALTAARQDMTIRTALLDSRLVVGNAALAETLQKRFESRIIAGTAMEFATAKLLERDQRMEKSDARRYVVEPNIKDGKGGLRDLHTLFWIARYAYNAPSVEAIIRAGILSHDEARVLSYAQRFLWTVRCHLHLRAGREDDRLGFDAQMDIAPLLGFHDRTGLSGVERFMKRYYLAAKSVGNLTRIFCAAIEADFARDGGKVKASFWQGLRRYSPFRTLFNQDAVNRAVQPFQLEDGRIALAEGQSFRKQPMLMMELFSKTQQTGLDIHPAALRRLTGSLSLVDAAWRKDKAVNAVFMDILTSRQSPERVLRLMNESGFLGKFMPDFGRIVAMMQFDAYHSYTVDEHTIFALGILNGIETGKLAEIAPLATGVIHEISQRRALITALLLHDIAKGRGGDHSVLGAEVARQLCPRLGLGSDETETVAWLVRHHLLMSETAFRYDLNDPMTISNFVAEVQSPERLNLLLVLTVADIRAVGPTVWNGWKAALMRDLYGRAMAMLRGANPDETQSSLASQAKTMVAEALATKGRHPWDEASIAAHLELFYPSYWTSFDSESQLRHARLCRRQQRDKALLTLALTPDTARNATELVIITADDAGLFSRIAGGVAASGASIVDARITTRKDGLVVDVFWLQDRDRQAISDDDSLNRLETTLREVLIGSDWLEEAIDRRHQQTPTRIRRIAAPARVLINNAASKTHTVIEINGKDAPGLLWRLTRCMAGLGLQIQSATVSTYGDRVVDVFYVKDSFGLKIDRPSRLQAIESKLLAVLQTSDPANQVAA